MLDRQMFGSSDTAGSVGPAVTVTIPYGTSIDRIGQILASARIVGSADEFVLRVYGDTGLKAGTYQLRENESYDAVIAALHHGPPPAPVKKLVIPEGFAIRDIARVTNRVGISQAAYLSALSKAVAPAGFLTGTEHAASLEGFLFPATYDVAQPADAVTLVHQQLVAFDAAFASVDTRYPARHHLTRYDVLKIASLVEREAAYPPDRAKIARVIYNRLHRHMVLGIDAEIQYAVGAWRPLTGPDLTIASPYNSRIHRGLPPTPISNPGLASIDAAAHPATGDWLYYVAIPHDRLRRSYFTNNYQDFLRFQAEHPA
jgi:UPF0755 protein